MKGIDVSMWQGNIDFAKVRAAGYDFVIIRCNNWDNGLNCVVVDPYFEQNYARAKAAGLEVGAFYFTWQNSVLGARKDAELCLELIRGKQFEYPIYFDLEWQKAFAQGRSVCSAMVEAFCGALEEAGFFAGLYISRFPLQDYITTDVAKRYALWIAEYDVNKPQYNGEYGMWQYSKTGRVPGISVNVDLDECYVDYPKIIKSGGFNGFPKQTEPTEQPEKPAESEQPTANIKGDVNGDGKVDIEDVVAIINHINGVKPLE